MLTSEAPAAPFLPTATNPWDCAAHARALPRFQPRAEAELELVTPDGLQRALARMLHRRPQRLPFRLASFDERLAYLLRTLAGYPDVGAGLLPQEEPLNPESRLALALTLQLDTLAPLAGRDSGSLRAELMWLDRVRRIPRDRPLTDDRGWLLLVLAWLLTGIGEQPEQLDKGHLLLNVCVAEDLAGVANEVRGAVVALQTVRLRLSSRPRRHVGTQFGLGGPGLATLAQHLYGMRWGRPLQLGRGAPDSAPPLDPEQRPEHQAGLQVVEARFHGIQTWLRTSSGHFRLGPYVHRGASVLLEAALSALRRTLLEVLGPGSLLVDGGGRLALLCPQAKRGQIRGLLRTAIDRLLLPGQPLGDRFATALQALEDDGSAPRPIDRRRLARLAWSCLPPFSLRFTPVDRAGGASLRHGPLPVQSLAQSEQRQDCLSCGGLPDDQTELEGGAQYERWKRDHICPPCRLKQLLGRWLPLERSLETRLGTELTARREGVCDASEPIDEWLALDLNGVGRLFLRQREEPGAPRGLERLARRSLRFSTHWLLAVGRLMWEARDAGVEMLLWGGDDLVLGLRHTPGAAPDGSVLLDRARDLDRQLEHLRDELPPCDRLDFAACLMRGSAEGQRASSRDRFARVLEGERWAKWFLGPDAERFIKIDDQGRCTGMGLLLYLLASGRHRSVVVTHTGSKIPEGAGFLAVGAAPPPPLALPWCGSLARTLAQRAGLDPELRPLARRIVRDDRGAIVSDELLVSRRSKPQPQPWIWLVDPGPAPASSALTCCLHPEVAGSD
jgi:hypothetical protein